MEEINVLSNASQTDIVESKLTTSARILLVNVDSSQLNWNWSCLCQAENTMLVLSLSIAQYGGETAVSRMNFLKWHLIIIDKTWDFYKRRFCHLA